jgi:hypothetical protein
VIATDAFVIATERDGHEWFAPTGHCRGPWDPDACHAGPPAGLLARASERLLPHQQLVRLTVDLTRPIPHAGFRIDASVVRAGRTVSTTELSVVDGDGRTVVTARAMHLAGAEGHAHDELPTTPHDTPRLAEAVPDRFPISGGGHDLPMFSGGVEVRYPPGDAPTPGPTRLWMRTVPLVLGEDPSPFQRICALADCGNAISRNAEPDRFAFMNTDLTVLLHRPPHGDWFGVESVSRWEPSGVGMSDSLLFDEQGPVGRALQTLLIRRR